MSTNRPEMEQRCTVLRIELKAWEKEFASEHDGRKAGREDIKANATISQKYKEYNKIRDVLSGKEAPQTPSKTSRKRKCVDEDSSAPPARSTDPSRTPSKKIRAEDDVPPDSPGSVAKMLSPAQGPAVIGPTPQRDGIVLGLFDLLPAETPSKGSRTILGEVVPNILQTPSKNRGKSEDEGSIEARPRGSRTPLSAGKRFLLDKFVTPKKRKRDNEGTPTSALKHLSTPAFLRRDNPLDIIAEEDENTPRPAPWKRRGLGRSLSAMIASMKKQEEERLDEELDIMREMEMEAEGIPIPKKRNVPDILVQDSQAPMKLGPDGAGGSEDEDETSRAEDGLDQNGNPRKVWKKRGQKRQTKRVIMRPVIHQPKPQASMQGSEEDSDSPDTVQETQVPPAGEDDSDGASEDGSSDYSDDPHTPKKRKTHHKKAAPKKRDKDSSLTKDGGTVKKAVRKVKESAHANYRKLKIKSKHGNGGKGRFGRRR